jgi:hypothetical protein
MVGFYVLKNLKKGFVFNISFVFCSRETKDSEILGLKYTE